jgi:SRSO17 transposase
VLTEAAWEPQALDQHRGTAWVAPRPPRGLLRLDDTGLPQPGRRAVGVARPYAGTLGQGAHGQGVVPAHQVAAEPTSRAPVHWPVTARLSLPAAWAAASTRCAQVRGPSDVTLQTKPERARVDQARTWGVPWAPVGPDAGDRPLFVPGLDDRPVAYVVGLRSTFGGGQPQQPRPAPLSAAQAVLGARPEDRGPPITWREDGAVVLRKQGTAVRVPWAPGGGPCSTTQHRVSTGPEGWRSSERPGPGDRGDRQWDGSNLLADTPRRRLGEWAPSRWPLEPFDADAKGAWGLDHDQGRRWDGRHRHLALVMVASRFLARQRWTPANSAGFAPRWGTPVLPGGPPPGTPVALPRGRLVAHRDQPDRPVPPQADLTK